MKKTLQLFLFGIIILFSARSHVFGGSHSYGKYCNDRYGFCVDFPKNLVLETPPGNGDGRRFLDNKGFLMVVSGMNNILKDTLGQEMTSKSKDFDKISYRANGKNWFVLSGNKGSDIIYLKTYIGKGSMNNLYIQYPSQHRNAYDEAVTRASRSFKPGDLSRAH